jgi:hypothetical protein
MPQLLANDISFPTIVLRNKRKGSDISIDFSMAIFAKRNPDFQKSVLDSEKSLGISSPQTFAPKDLGLFFGSLFS